MRLVAAGSSTGDEAVPVPAFVSSFGAEILNLDGGPVVTVRGDVDMATADRLWAVIEQRRVVGNAGTSHSARLLSRGTQKVAQKLGEEAVELVIEAVVGNRGAIISESADVLYHLLVLWVDAGIAPGEVWAELRRREGMSGIAEKAARPKALVRLARTTKLP